MTFLERLNYVSDVGHLFPYVVCAFLVGAVALLGILPDRRVPIRNAILLFLFSVIGTLITAGLFAPDHQDQVLAYFVLRWVSMFLFSAAILTVSSVLLFDVFLEGVHLAPPRILRDLMVGLAYVVTAIVLLSRSGVNVSGIVATSAVVTAVIGFSLQDTLGNLMGGMALQMERSISVGDWIRIEPHEGRVKEIRWRQTSIETRNWDTVVVPNSALMRSQVVVLGRRTGMPAQRRQWVYFNVDFRYPPTDVIDAVENALRAEPIPNVAHEPLPNCVLTDFKESYGSYAVRYWLTDLAVDDPTNSIIRSRIYFALRRIGVPLSIPAQSVFVTTDEPGRRARKHDQEIDRRLEALRSVELFHTLTDAERHELAERLTVAPFARGEVIVRQGIEAHHLYIVMTGVAEVRATAAEGDVSKVVATLGAGDVVGEMGMMTGEPRRATVIARTDVECYRLDKAGFQSILRGRPEIAHDLSQVLAHRSVELEAVREGLTEEVKRRRVRDTQGDFVHRILRFFAIESG